MPARLRHSTHTPAARTRGVAALCALLLLAAACRRAASPDELARQHASGVALLTNRYHFSAALPTGQVITFTDINSDGTLAGLTLPPDTVVETTVTATAFVVGQHGEVLTSRAAAAPALHANAALLAHAVVNAMTNTVEARQQECRQAFRQIEWEINSVMEYDPLTDSFSGDAFRIDTLRSRQLQQIGRAHV